MRSRRILALLTGAATALALGLQIIAPAVPAAPLDRGVVVTPNPLVLTSGKNVAFTVQLVGATAAEVERGIAWVASEPARETQPGWTVTGPGASGTVTRTRDQGDRAEFSFAPTGNGHWSFTLEPRDAPTQTPLAGPLTVVVDVNSIDLPTLPNPPTNLRIETQGLASPAPGTKVYFQARVAADYLAMPFQYNGTTVSKWAKVTVSGPFGLQMVTGEPATSFIDVTSVWIDTRSPDATVKLKYLVGPGTVVYTRTAVPTGLVFDAATVIQVYPAATMLRCSDSSSKLTCQVALGNAGRSTHAMPVTPPGLPVKIQYRTYNSETSRWTPWSPPRVVTANLNPTIDPPSIALAPSGPSTVRHEVRVSLPGSPDATVTVTVGRSQPIEASPWRVSNRALLKPPQD